MRRINYCQAAAGIALACALAMGPWQACAADVQATSDAPAPGYTYKLGSGDKLRIAVFGVDKLSGEFQVPGSGRISFPLIGDIQASGLTAPQLQDEIATALKDGYLQDPRVNVEVETYRPFYILGEVNKPGEYPYSDGLTVLKAVATAEGFTYRAKTGVFRERHLNEAKDHSERLLSDTPVQPGDTIRILERSF
jgi:polysaccharide export outer membrane protein